MPRDPFGWSNFTDSWWSHPSSSSPSPPLSLKPQRPPAQLQSHIEVIGGGRQAPWPLSASVPSSARQSHAAVTGPPRLPPELSTGIVLLAALSIWSSGPLATDPDDRAASHDHRASIDRLLALCTVNRACHRIIFATCLLPEIHLYGTDQIDSFHDALRANTNGLRDLARTRVRKLDVRLSSLRSRQAAAGPDSSRGTSSAARKARPALYDAAAAQAQFERATLHNLQTILAICQHLDCLALECMPRALDGSGCPSSDTSGRQPAPTGFSAEEHATTELASRLRRFSCHMSVYAGYFNDRFWHCSKGGRWAELSHLQLYGPRFRFTLSTARALAQLPSLSHLALIMPHIVQNAGTTLDLDQEAAALDLQGHGNVLQVLVSRAVGLQVLLVVGHEMVHYVGCTERYRPWLRALHRRTSGTQAETASTRVQLVTARERQGRSKGSRDLPTHPSLFGRWMMDRTERKREWGFEPSHGGAADRTVGIRGGGLDLEQQEEEEREMMEYTLEAWDLPCTEWFDHGSASGSDGLGYGAAQGLGSASTPGMGTVGREGEVVGDGGVGEEAEAVYGIDNLE